MKALTFTTAGFVALILSVVSVLAMLSDPLDGEPFIFLDVEDKSSRFDTTKAADPHAYDPRFPVIAVQPYGAPTAKPVPPQTPPSRWKTVLNSDQADLQKQPEQKPRPVVDTMGPTRLSPVPVRDLVQYSQYGPLPKIAKDGRIPADIYARPTKSLNLLFGPGEPAKIGIIVNGMGLSSVETHEAIQKLPGPVTLAFSPYGNNIQGWVRKAREHGHEVMLQVPFEPFDYPDNDPGPHTLLTALPPQENLKRLQWLMSRFTGYMGVTNAMGAKFMSSAKAVRPVLQELKLRGLLYVDTTGSARSMAPQIAGDAGLGFGQADLVIDSEVTLSDIDASLKKLEQLALERGMAVGVGSSLPITIRRIENWAKSLKKKGIVLLPISAIVKARQQRT